MSPIRLHTWLNEYLLAPMMRRNDHNWIQTYTGKKFYPADPSVEDIDIEDIAHALSNMCRFTGHTKEFYSVAQHSVLASWICEEGDRMWALLHDASEAYLTDVAKPIKPILVGYDHIEDRLMSAICERFGLPKDQPASVKIADMIMLATEQRDLLCSPPAEWTQTKGVTPAAWGIVPWFPKHAKNKFLERFYQLYEGEK